MCDSKSDKLDLRMLSLSIELSSKGNQTPDARQPERCGWLSLYLIQEWLKISHYLILQKI